MGQYAVVVHGLTCDICKNCTIEDGASEAQYAKLMRIWARESGWGYHKGKDYCHHCEFEYQSKRNTGKGRKE